MFFINKAVLSTPFFGNVRCRRTRVARIVGGTPAGAKEYPAYAVPVAGDLCGAVLIHSDILLTAGHCEGVFEEGQDVYIGGSDLDGANARETIGVDREVVHYDFDSVTLGNDLMLVKLVKKSTATPLKWNTDSSLPNIGDKLTIMGYGQTSETGYISQDLLDAEITVTRYYFCKRAYADLYPVIRRNMFCAYPGVYAKTSSSDEWIRSTICTLSDYKPSYC